MLDEVRAERFALIREAIEEYDVDGFELQLNYVPWYFHPSGVASGKAAPVLTAFISAVKAVLDATGPGKELVIRVPGLAHCDEAGLDVREWCRLGLCDVLIAENDDGNRCDPNFDFSPFVAIASGRCALATRSPCIIT
eukprot:SAG11_NODE_8103_length_1060_cov_0.947971_2_plen_138_part_00